MAMPCFSRGSKRCWGVSPDKWVFEAFQQSFSLNDFDTLSKTRKDWQQRIKDLFDGDEAKSLQLLQAFEACVPGLQPVLAARNLTTKDSTPLKLLYQLWTMVSFLRQSRPWGPALAAVPGLLVDFTGIHTVPHLPKAIAEYFVKHMDVHINYQQLLTAAHNRLAGAEVWVQIHDELNEVMGTDIPDIAVKICCGRVNRKDLDTWRRVGAASPQSTLDILQLALNGSNHQVAACVAAKFLSEVTDTSMLVCMLRTAVMRGHHGVLRSAVTTPAVQQLEAAAVLQLMQTAADAAPQPLWQPVVVQPGHWHGPPHQPDAFDDLAFLEMSDDEIDLEHHFPPWVPPVAPPAASERSIVHWLVQLPAAARLSTKKLAPLIQTASQQGCGASVKAICGLSAAKELSPSMWIRAMTSAIKKRSDPAVRELCSLRAATARLSPEMVLTVLTAAVSHLHRAAVTALCDFPAARFIPSQQLFKLAYQLAQQLHGPAESSRLVCKTLQAMKAMEVVQEVTTPLLLKLLQKLVQRNLRFYHGLQQPVDNSQTVLQWLHRLPAAVNIPVEVLLQHIQDAMQQQDVDKLSALCQFPAASRLATDDAYQLFGVAVHGDSSKREAVLQQLCQLPVAEGFNQTQVSDLLFFIVESGQTIMPELLALPAALQLPTDILADLLFKSVMHQNLLNVGRLRRVQVVGSLSSGIMMELIKNTISCKDDVVGPVLCSYSSAMRIGVDDLEALLSKAIRSGLDGIVSSLCQLPNAKALAIDVVQELIAAAVQSKSVMAVQSLCKLPRAAQIVNQGAKRLLETAVQVLPSHVTTKSTA